MGFINVEGMDDVREERAVKEDAYDLRIHEVVDTDKSGEPLTSESGRDMIRCMILIEGNAGEDAAPIFHYLTFPRPDDEPRTRKMMIRNIKRFLHIFGVTWGAGGFDASDLEGATADKVVLRQEEYDGVMRNVIQVPRLPEDRG